MKTLHTIVALVITSIFSLNAMDTALTMKEYMGLETYHDRYVNHYSGIYTYSQPSWNLSNTKDPQNCRILNAYVLLNRRPNESVEQQLEFYTQNLEKIEKALTYFPASCYYFEKKQLQQKQAFLQAIIPQIKQANLSGKVQDLEIQEKVTTALHNIVNYNGTDDYRFELNDLHAAVQNAHKCEFIVVTNESKM